MKKFVLFLSLIGLSLSSTAFAIYDFCESPADYNTFPQAYDVRTEYWKDIPNYNADNIKFENMKNENPVFPFNKKKQKQDRQKNEPEK